MNYIEKEKVIRHVEAATRAIYASVPVDPVHPVEHTIGVVVNTLKICQGDNIPIFLPVVAAWLHDFGRPAEYQARQNGIELHHAEESAHQVPIVLRPFRESLDDKWIHEIQTAVADHSKLNSPNDSLTTKILKDADRLEGLGSIGLRRTITAKYGSPLYNPSNPFPDKRTPRIQVTSEEVPVVEGMLYTIEWFTMLRMPTAIKLGLSRVQQQIRFLEGLVEELDLSRDLLEQNEIIQEARRATQLNSNSAPLHI